MAAVLEHTDELHGLAENPTLPAPLLDLFIATADQALCADLADRDDLTPERVGALARRGGDLVAPADRAREDPGPRHPTRRRR